MEKCTPAIVFGDYISAYSAVRGLSKHKVPVFMVSKTGKGIATKSKYVKEAVALDPREDAFIEKLVSWCHEHVGKRAVLIVGGDDDYLDVIAQRRDELPSGMVTTFPDWEVVRKVREKRATYDIARELDIPMPKTFYVTNLSELESVLAGNKGSFEYPLFMKAEDSGALLKNYGIKGAVCKDSDEVIDNYKRYDGFGGELLLQEMLLGKPEKIVTVLMSLNSESEPTGLLINEKKRSAGEFLSGTLVATTWSDKLLNHSLKLVKKIGYYGYAGVQFKWDPRDSEFKLMEINGRISMSSSLAFRCGINLPYLMYQEAINSPLPALEKYEQKYRNNVLWWYPTADIIALPCNGLHTRPFKFIKSLMGRGYILEPFSWRDPYPGWLSTKWMLSIFFKKFFLRK